MPPNVSLQIVCYHLPSLQNANLMCSTLYVHGLIYTYNFFLE